MFYKKAVLKNFAIFTGKKLCWSLFLVRLQAEKRLQHRCFPMHIANFLTTSILKNISERLLLIFFYYSNLFVFGRLFTINYAFYGEECLLKLDYVIQ